MRVHHLCCGTFRPLVMAEAICHVLLCETDDGLVLIDSGLGTHDLSDPAARLGAQRFFMRPDTDLAHTAIRQIEARGFGAGDVSHIVLTHMDFDHVGGLADFPAAQVHTTADEYAAAVTDPDFLDKRRYRPIGWAHGPRITTHEGRGDRWDHDLTGHEVVPGITIIPMPGHSRGHAAVAVDAGTSGTLIHAGDALFDASCLSDTSPSGRPLTKISSLRAFEQVVGRDRKAISENHTTLARLQREKGITVIPAHDKRIFNDLVTA